MIQKSNNSNLAESSNARPRFLFFRKPVEFEDRGKDLPTAPRELRGVITAWAAIVFVILIVIALVLHLRA